MTEADQAQIPAMLSERHVDLIVLRPESAEAKIYNPAADELIFYERLMAGDVPDFLETVGLPAELNGRFMVYRVIY